MEVSIVTSQKITTSQPEIEIVGKFSEATKEFVMFLDKTDKLFSDLSIFKDFNVDKDIEIVQFTHLRENSNGIYVKKSFLNDEGVHIFSQSEPNFKCTYDKLFRRTTLARFIEKNDTFKISSFFNKKYYYLNKIIITHEILDKIDFVFPYVTDSDLSWVAEKNKYLNESNDNKYTNYNEKNFGTGIQRFRDTDMLKYMFRAINDNMPFINNVYMIVMSDSQVPSWVDRSKVKIVYHKDFIPAKYLPTFCSNTIEMFLWNIPGLSEKFIYANDDMYITKPQVPSEWFKNNYPALWCEERPRNWEWSGDEIRNRNYKLLTGSLDENTVVDEQHGIFPMRKSLIKECFFKYQKEILGSITRFRDPKNYNQWLWSNYAFYQGKIFKKKRKMSCRILNNKNRNYVYNWKLKDYILVCLNDGGEEQTEEDVRVIHEKFDEHFPNKSRFEV